MIKQILYCLVVLLVVVGCKSIKTAASAEGEVYKEDLSVLRPRYNAPKIPLTSDIAEETSINYAAITPSSDVTKKLNVILDSVDILKKDVRSIQGYTIKVYWGRSSEVAHLTRGKIYSILPGSNPQLDFNEPNFIVKVGKYYSVMEAQEQYSQLKEVFPNATIVPERIYIR